MKKIILPILIVLLVSLCPASVFAAEGTIRVNLPEDMAGEVVRYAKEGEEQQQTVTVDASGIAKVENLEEGTYQIEISETSEYVFAPALVSIPTWSEEEHRMLYDVTVIPKYNRKIKVVEKENVQLPVTGDDNNSAMYIGAGAISLILVVIMSCHNRFKCGRMSDKYSRKRRI